MPPLAFGNDATFTLFQERTLTLDQSNLVKIGRSVARIRPSATNGIFDCKVLSRNHAVIWYDNKKVPGSTAAFEQVFFSPRSAFHLRLIDLSDFSFISKTRKVRTGRSSTTRDSAKARRTAYRGSFTAETSCSLALMSSKTNGRVKKTQKILMRVTA